MITSLYFITNVILDGFWFLFFGFVSGLFSVFSSGECIHFENEPKTMNILNGGSTNSKTVSGKCDKV